MSEQQQSIQTIDASQMASFDSQVCQLGEGPLWHPQRQSLFWFDILSATLHERSDNTRRSWSFDQMVSAAGWINTEELLIASETELLRFNLETGSKQHLIALEADNPVTRSNDGRADPWGGFWIGTMGKQAEPGAGAIYRFYRGELRLLVSGISISNAICFSPDRRFAFYTDTPTRQVMRVALDAESGWPRSGAEIFLDLNHAGLNPDGAVFDDQGNIWIACWGDSSVHSFSPEGRHLRRIVFPAKQISCPAFGGADLSQLYATSAAQGVTQANVEPSRAGNTFIVTTGFTGVAEPAVNLKHS